VLSGIDDLSSIDVGSLAPKAAKQTLGECETTDAAVAENLQAGLYRAPAFRIRRATITDEMR
jgi:hypothetical protein